MPLPAPFADDETSHEHEHTIVHSTTYYAPRQFPNEVRTNGALIVAPLPGIPIGATLCISVTFNTLASIPPKALPRGAGRSPRAAIAQLPLRGRGCFPSIGDAQTGSVSNLFQRIKRLNASHDFTLGASRSKMLQHKKHSQHRTKMRPRK